MIMMRQYSSMVSKCECGNALIVCREVYRYGSCQLKEYGTLLGDLVSGI